MWEAGRGDNAFLTLKVCSSSIWPIAGKGMLWQRVSHWYVVKDMLLQGSGEGAATSKWHKGTFTDGTLLIRRYLTERQKSI